MRHLSGYALHGPDLRGVRPYQVIGLVWLANVVGAGILIVDYLWVLPFPEGLSTESIQRGNVLLGSASAGSCSGSSERRERIARWTGRSAGWRRTRRSASSP